MKSNSSLHVVKSSDHHSLMTFKYLPDHSHQANVAILPLEVLCRSAGYSEYWIDGAEVSLLKTDSGGEMTSQNHLAVIYNSSESNIETVTKQAYEQAFQSSKANRCTHLIRTWNYLHDINGSDNGLERYQSFCVARHEMLEKFEQLTTPNPAATAIGSHNGENVFVFLFAKQAGHVIENKRQVSAWEYPKKYAPKQPRFSRAMKYGPVLMCSGTASVVGHETLHLNDVLAQLDECLKNVSVLLSEDENKYPIQSGLYRFYLREVEHAGLVEAKIIDFGIENYIVLHGDVCRENLLIECEVVFQ